MSPEEVRPDLITRFNTAAIAGSSSFVGNVSTADQMEGSEEAFYRAGIAAIYREIESEIRASLKAELERASEGRASYGTNAPEDMRDVLETEANALRNAAAFVGGDQSMMLAWLPSRMWTDAEQKIARGVR